MVHTAKRLLPFAFQFLIGTIKTEDGTEIGSRYRRVSIPHRYDQNMCVKGVSGLAINVSIPHRYDQNYPKEDDCDACTRVSIPHRYDQNCHVPR